MHRECGRMALVKQNADFDTQSPGKAVALANGAYRRESHYKVLRDESACTNMNTTDYEYMSTLSVPQGCFVDHPGEQHVLYIWNSAHSCLHIQTCLLQHVYIEKARTRGDAITARMDMQSCGASSYTTTVATQSCNRESIIQTCNYKPNETCMRRLAVPPREISRPLG